MELTFRINVFLYKVMGFVKWLELYRSWTRLVPREQDDLLRMALKMREEPIERGD